MRCTFLLIIMLLSRLVNAQKDTFIIQRKLENAKSNKIFLYIADIITGTTRVDSAAIEGGIFTLNGNAPTALKAIKDSLHTATVHAGKLNTDFVALKTITDVIANLNRKLSEILGL
ncbi:DUF4369 domain-containing protein [Dyadobacter sp. CY261]|uniref:DUF4369 domain-containing protein n=1 Tax=Dyadobacter sp. CY261 TaxID=2907203 RepID=UPI001F3549EC|nr:DUF4369 domain-containing protein [Dyadobacter sp. CY261]MCF0074134.1 DUF4369 domain-containing protein [Dyadobacter sp. CY261]